MTSAKVFKNGRSQAIRLPKEFRVKSTEVFLRKVPEGILITERDPWEICEEGCREISDKFLEAMESRDKTTKQERQWWWE